MPDINDILFKRGQIIDGMRKILDKAEAEDRELTAEEQTQYDAMDKDQEALQKRAKRMENMADLESGLDTSFTNSNRGVGTEGNAANPLGTEAYANAFDQYARNGGAVANPSILNALQVGTDSEGGYITPEEFETQLVAELQDINELRNYVTVISTAGDRNIPVESTLGSATWTAEEAAYTESDAAFGQVVLGAHKLGTIIKVSEELLRDSFFDLQGYLARNFALRFGLAEETAFVNGTGSGQPTGMIDGASAGVTAAGAAAITSDELIDLYHSLGRPYRRNGTFMMKDSTAKLVRKLKDGDSQYLWQPGLQAGQPDMLLGRPVLISDGMEAATTGNVSMLFGDLSYYTVAERSGRVFQRLNELYAANGQVGFRMYERVDGKVTLSAAIKKLTQA